MRCTGTDTRACAPQTLCSHNIPDNQMEKIMRQHQDSSAPLTLSPEGLMQVGLKPRLEGCTNPKLASVVQLSQTDL